jgi:DNA-binding NtrC family response regulator
LRERREDVPLLLRHLLEERAKHYACAVPELSPEALACLAAYAWPGNVRELRNVLERAIITSADGRLHLDRALPATEPAASPAGGEPPQGGEILSERGLRQLERDNMLAALARASWRVGGEGGAAHLLGVRPSTFKSRMKALGIWRADRAPPSPVRGEGRAPGIAPLSAAQPRRGDSVALGASSGDEDGGHE